MKSWVKSEVSGAMAGARALAVWVLGPMLALQGCAKEEPQPAATVKTEARALTAAPGAEGGAALVLGPTYQKIPAPIAWRTITGTNLNLTDDSVANFTSPFTITFAGAAAGTTVRVGMNGALWFASTGSLGTTNAQLPSATYTTLVSAHWDDLYPGPTAADNVVWGVLGTAPNRELVIEWRNVHNYATRTGTNTMNFQVVLFEGISDILFNYKDVLVGNPTYDKAATATIGVQNTATDANQHSYNTASIDNDTALLWLWPSPSQPPVVDSVDITPATVNEGDTISVNAVFSDPDGTASAPWILQADIDYNGTTFVADLSANVASQGPASVSGVVRNSGPLTVGVRVLDRGSTSSTVSTTTITVADVPPAAAALAGPATTPELTPVTLTSSFTDPGLDGPWKVQWDFDYDGTTFNVDQESNATTPGNISLSHGFANDGTYTVGLRVTDKDGVSSTVQTLQVTVSDLAPLLTGIAGNTDLLEGSPLELLSSFTDPGDHSKPWTVQWDLDYDGTTFNVMEEESYNAAGAISFSRDARDSGDHTYALRVVDNDGSVSQVQVIDMHVAEANPVLSPLNAQFLVGTGDEPSVVSFDLSASSGAENPTADPLRAFLWDFDGDGSFEYVSTSPYAFYSYRDNKAGGGAYTARVRVLDEDSYSEEEVSVDIQNVAPTLSAPANVPVTEGTLMAVRLAASDPGADALTFAVTGMPEGMTLTADGLLLWTPAFKHTSGAGKPYTLTATVTDDDGATATQTITVVARWKDFDNDGMADTWEVEHGLNPTVNDAAGDRNGDGVTNLAEFLSGNGGPRLPSNAVASGPASGSKVNAAQINLAANNVTDAGDVASVSYQFQVFADAALTSMVRDVTVAQAATGSVTTATITDGTESPTLTDLDDDHVYAWRVRATDGASMHGAWSDVQSFTFNPVNDAPDSPRAAQPLSGTQVSTDLPLLVVDNALDVDDSDLTYVFELAENSAMTTGKLTSSQIPAGAKGSTSWAVTTALKPFVKYFWRATAKDPQGATAQSEVSSFTVYIGRPGNREPGIPALSAPSANGTVATLTPELVADAAVDSDGDALTYFIEVDTSAAFTSPSHQVSASLQAGQDGKVRWQPTALTENQRYYWRARAQDPYSASDWMVGSFVVNAQNDAPAAPVALNPSDAIIFSLKPTLIIQNSTDPEGDAITYSFEVRGADGAVAASGDAAAGANGHTSFSVGKELEAGGEYVWVARAKDAAGAVSAASAEARFQVYKAPELPQPVQDDGGCSAGAGAMGGLLPLLAVALGMFRRRRS